MKTRAKFGVGVGIILVTLVWLGWIGARESKTYYYTVAELARLDATQGRQRMRVRGAVRAGSIARLPGRVDFIVEEESHRLPVSYVGREPLPDTLVDGAEAVVEGRRMPDGRFVAERVQAKCASKYEAAPGQEGPGYSRPGKRPAAPADSPATGKS